MKHYQSIIAVLILLFIIKSVSFMQEADNVSLTDGDIEHYLLLAESYTKNVTMSGRTYQYPPLFPLLLIPASYMDTVTYIIILNIILSVLSFFPLYLISIRHTTFNKSVIIAFFVVLINIVFSIKSFGFPIILSSLLFAWFIYFFQDIRIIRNNLYYSSIIYALMIMSKLVFIYMLPFIIISILLFRDDKIKSLIRMSIIPGTMVCAYLLFNGLQHGFTTRGMIGGYITILTNDFLAIDIGTIIPKIQSIFTTLEPNTMMTYYSVFFVVLAMIWGKYKRDEYVIFSLKEIDFLILLSFNYLVFFWFPSMTYSYTYLNWRYISYFTPVYLVFAFIPLIDVFESVFNEILRILRKLQMKSE